MTQRPPGRPTRGGNASDPDVGPRCAALAAAARVVAARASGESPAQRPSIEGLAELTIDVAARFAAYLKTGQRG